MRALTIALTLLATSALADEAGVASVIDGDTIEVHEQRLARRLAAVPGVWGVAGCIARSPPHSRRKGSRDRPFPVLLRLNPAARMGA